MSGFLSGELLLNGDRNTIEVLTGDFSTAHIGGTLVINDTRFLENIARNTNQPVDILVESFQNYHYNSGTMKLSKEKDNLILDVALDGELGKRDLTVTLHNF